MFASASKTASATAANYIEDVFSTYLYTGAGSASQTISNGIDLAGKGGMVWSQSRAGGVYDYVADTLRGVNKNLVTQTTDAEGSSSSYINAFNSNGFGVGVNAGSSGVNFASWTFRKQPKFFDVVTWTGDGATTRNISHALGVQPAAFFVKASSTTGSWHCVFSYNGGSNYYMGDTANGNFALNSTNAAGSGRTAAAINISSTTIDVAKIKYDVATAGYEVNAGNQNGVAYVAYIFASNAGGFGLTGSDNVITCGSFTTTSNSATVNLGWEPQWLLIKGATTVPGWGAGDWAIFDSMRGISTVIDGSTPSARLMANTTGAEVASTDYQAAYTTPTSTGFQFKWSVAGTGTEFIYIAIRRGPMKTPTIASTVFDVVQQNAGQFVTTNNVVDMLIETYNLSTYNYPAVFPRLTGKYMETNSSAAEGAGGPYIGFDYNTGIKDNYVGSGLTALYYLFQRAPSFMDVVCYTGTGANTSFSHNLTVAPEMMIFKRRSSSGSWLTYHKDVGNDYSLSIESTAAKSYSPTTFLNSTSPTASVFTVGIATSINFSGSTYVAYLFASCPGVSKVGSYSGTGATQTISCGFAARFVLIKRTDSTGSWWVWDTARGMVAGTDPRLALNSTAAETNADWVYTDASGFQIVTTDATVNASGGSYIFLAIA